MGFATGLVVGLLGLGYVEVPEEFVERALDILGTAVNDDATEGFDEEDDTAFQE